MADEDGVGVAAALAVGEGAGVGVADAVDDPVGVGAGMGVNDSRAFCTAGNSRAIRMPMIAMTTSSSINVKPAREDGDFSFCMRCPIALRYETIVCPL